MNIEKIISEIIPPSDYQHRNGFNNKPIIDKLTDNEKKQLEDILIRKLLFESDEGVDTLLIETLAYLKSIKSLPVLREILDKCSNDMTKLIISASIFEIGGDSKMIDVAILSLRKLDNDKDPYYKYNLPSAFYYLAKFQNVRVNRLIEEYINHKDYLISYNAKQVLGM